MSTGVGISCLTFHIQIWLYFQQITLRQQCLIYRMIYGLPWITIFWSLMRRFMAVIIPNYDSMPNLTSWICMYVMHVCHAKYTHNWTFRIFCCCIHLKGLQTPCNGVWQKQYNPDSKIHRAYMGPTWGRQDPGGPHVGPMILVIWESYSRPSAKQWEQALYFMAHDKTWFCQMAHWGA